MDTKNSIIRTVNGWLQGLMKPFCRKYPCLLSGTVLVTDWNQAEHWMRIYTVDSVPATALPFPTFDTSTSCFPVAYFQ